MQGSLKKEIFLVFFVIVTIVTWFIIIVWPLVIIQREKQEL